MTLTPEHNLRDLLNTAPFLNTLYEAENEYLKRYRCLIKPTYEKEKTKMENKMTRADIESGYVVKLRNGDYRMAIRVGGFTKILADKFGNWAYLSRWGDDLSFASCTKGPDPMDIVAVYGLVREPVNYSYAFPLSPSQRDLLWERKDPTKLTVAEIEKLLGYEIEIVAEPK